MLHIKIRVLVNKKDKDTIDKERLTFLSKIFHQKRIDEWNDFMVSIAVKNTEVFDVFSIESR